MMEKKLTKYQEWINKHYPTKNSATGMCSSATSKMIKDFPELIRVRGHVFDAHWGLREHWWCKNGDEIVDPTAHQFPYIVDYEELDESLPHPTGKCLECGEYTYEYKQFCDWSCERSFAADLF